MPNILVNSSYYLMMGKIIHKVNKGEDLNSLAKKYRIPAYIIARENNIANIYMGMRIIIPSPRGMKYVVQPFDTLEEISKKYNIDTKLISSNNYGIKKVFLGQVIYIPYES